ncbi:MAG: PAS domain S-box protein [Chloroflexota bacterium]
MFAFWRQLHASFRSYLIAIGGIAIALVVRQWLDPVLGDRLPFGVFFIAVMIIAWWTELKPTLLALVIATLIVFFWFIPPRNSFAISSAADILGWVIFFGVGLGSAVISEANRKARKQAEASAQAAQTAIQQLEQELTEHQATLSALNSKDIELKDMIENAVTPIHWVDKAGQIIWANQAELDLLGYRPAEYIGHSIAEFHADQAVITVILERLSHDELLQSYEARLRCKDGSIKYVLINSSVYRKDGQFIHTRCFTHDISERKVIEEIQSRLSAIVEFSDDAIVSKTLDGIVASWNAGAKRIFGYSAEEMIGKSIRILFPPELLHEEDEFIRRLSRGEHIDHYETIRVRKDGQRIDISVTLSPIQDASGTIIGASKIAQDITQRKHDEQRSKLLLELTTAFSRALTSEQLAEVMVEQASKSLGATVGIVASLVEDGATLEILNLRSTAAYFINQYRRTAADFSGPLNDAVRTGQMVWIETLEDHLRRYPHFETAILRRGNRSTIAMPLRVDEKIIGGMAFSFPVDKACNSDEAAFFTTLAYLFAQSLERARLYEAEQQERSLAEALRDTVVALSSTWDLSEVFDQILSNIDHVVKHDVADIMLIEERVARVVRSHRYAEHGFVTSESEMQGFSLTVADTPHLKWAAEHRQPSIIDDTLTDGGWIKVHNPDLIRSTLIVPILINREIQGFLNVDSLLPNSFSAADGKRLQTFADQAAVAIRNAQLYQGALEMAALEERQRIARDLHDAVSQTLFSANLIAESLPRTWERQPEKALAQTNTLHQLTRGAAAEMRVLLVELRPESLTTTPLSELLTQLGYSLHGKTTLDLSLVIRGASKQLLPPEVQIVFYRIAQESLNNILKHGHATQVRIRLLQTETLVTLVITDNGEGFDTHQHTGGIGLNSMRERADSIHAHFNLKSTVGRGTQIRLIWDV